MPHVYALGAVKPWVRSAAQEIGDKFDISTIFGVGARAEASDHPLGLATDFMVYTDRAKGDSVAAYLKQNWARLNVKYIIWQQRIDNGSGWEPMEDRGGNTANHRDHVHTSYNSADGSGKEYSGNTSDTSGNSSDSGGGITGALAPLASAATWIRVLEFVAGVIMLAAVAWSLIQRGVIGNAAT